MRGLLKLLCIISVCAVVSCGTDERPLNIMIIGVDTLRPDALGCYGYERSTSPNTDRLAGEGVLFENVVSQAPWTLPSFATVFTSLYPDQHGAFHVRASMRTTFPTLGELLRDSGYTTGAIINAPYLKPKFKMDRGFDFYAPPKGRLADATTADALKWIDLNRENPFFIFAHYFDPHLPYSPPAPYDTLFDPDYTGRIGRAFDLNRFPDARTTNFEAMRTLTSADWHHIRALYDGEVAFTDEAIGDLLDGLKERGLRKNTLVIFLSDHGEEFFEHEGFEHGHTLYDELIRAPLIFSLPGELPRGERISRQVRLIDIAPTILDFLGLEPGTGFEGVSLKPLLTGTGSIAANRGSLLPPEIAYAEATIHGPDMKSVTAYPWKLIYDMTTGERSCFNLAEDPGEHHDISDVPSQSLSLLETALFMTLLGITDTWFVEMVGGDQEHSFDLEVTCEGTRPVDRFDFHRVLHPDGSIVDTEETGNAEITLTRIKIRNLKVKEPLTLALKIWRDDTPLRFDLKIDGEPATQRTFIGESLANPDGMSFVFENLPDDTASRGKPVHRPEPPYFLVWRSVTAYEGETTIELDEKTREELRSLGYIQ